MVDLTPKVLGEWRSIPATALERELNKARVKHLREKADAGQLLTFQWVACMLDGVKSRTNGQHSGEMLAAMLAEGVFPPGLKAHLELYEAESKEAVALLFRQFDDRKSGRTSDDIAGVYQGLYPELNDVDKEIGKLAIDSYLWFCRYVEKVPVPVGDDGYSFLNDTGLYGYIHWLADIHRTSKSKELRNRYVGAAMWATFETNETAARSFGRPWRARLAYPSMVRNRSVDLDQWLLGLRWRHRGAPRSQQVPRCDLAWNAFPPTRRSPQFVGRSRRP